MGWNNLSVVKDSLLLSNINKDELDFYFVHSYFCRCKNPNDVIAQVDYGVLMDVAINKENIFDCQFHPEKSQRSGLQIIKNFCVL